jgi:hypothetical protein
MNSFVEMMTEKDSLTANGAITNSTSHNYNVDLFFLAGACRNESVENIENALSKSYVQDRLKTLKIIFWAGDIRQGAGERRFFKIALSWLSKYHPEDIQNNLKWIPEFSRWDVIFDLAMENEVLFSFILTNLANPNSSTYGLLCKWLPRKNYARDVYKHSSDETYTQKDKFGNSVKCYSSSSSKSVKKRSLYGGLAGKLMKALNMTPKQYRKMLVEGSKTVEQQMCAKKWNEIEYSKVPSVAMHKYTKAWYRNDQTRFERYLESVQKGESKMNAGVIFPHDIVKDAIRSTWNARELTQAEVVQWNSLPNWLDGKPNSIIPVCDVSGSMTCNNGIPMAMSVGLGLYISERNVGPFKDAFITFSDDPHMQVLYGDINQRIKQLVNADWGGSTNLIRVFQIILQKAIDTRLSQDLMPKTILVISDMEFNSCGRLTNYETIKQAYHVAGYECPQIVFWNVNGRTGNIPVTINEKGVALISGASPSIIRSVLTDNISPEKVMNSTIDVERYSVVK